MEPITFRLPKEIMDIVMSKASDRSRSISFILNEIVKERLSEKGEI